MLWKKQKPVFIEKDQQVLITISPKDFSFISIDDINKIVSLIETFEYDKARALLDSIRAQFFGLASRDKWRKT